MLQDNVGIEGMPFHQHMCEIEYQLNLISFGNADVHRHNLAVCALLPLAIRSIWLLWPLLFIWGGAAFGVYTVALAGLGDRYSGAMLLTGSAAFGLMWGVGGIIGPASAGGAMQLWGPAGLPIILGIPFALFTFMLLWRHFNFRTITK